MLGLGQGATSAGLASLGADEAIPWGAAFQQHSYMSVSHGGVSLPISGWSISLWYHAPSLIEVR